MWHHQHSSSNLLYELSQKHYGQRLIMFKFSDVIVESVIQRLNMLSQQILFEYLESADKAVQ